MRRILTLFAVGCCLALLFAAQSQAQTSNDPTTIHYVCTGTTVCSPGATTLVTGSTIPTFDLTLQGQTGLTPNGSGSAQATLSILVFVPGSAPSLTFSINGNAAANAGTFSSGNILSDGVTGFFAAMHSSTSDPNVSAFESASGQSGTTPSSLTVYVVNFGTVTVTGLNNAGSLGGTIFTLASVGSGGITGLPAGGFPLGTVFYAMLANCTGGGCVLTSSTTDVVNSTPLSESLTIVPEPASLALFGSGMISLALAVRRRFRAS
jgi:PEP-CTERM motif-containing protein